MSTPAGDRSELPAGLGGLPFDLGAEELRHRANDRLAHAQSALDELVARTGPRTISSFLDPLNRLLSDVRDVSSHGSLVFAVHTDPATRTAGREVSEEADQFVHAFRLNGDAYAALRSLDLTAEDDETRFAVEKMRREMRRSGVEKDATTRARLLELNREIDRVADEYSENIANLERGIDLDSSAELAGLPTDYRETHRPGPSGKIRVSTRYPDFLPVMAYADSSDVRRRLLFEFMNRAYPENVPVLARLLGLRDEYARRLGYPNYAAFAIEDKMVATPDAVRVFLGRVAGRLTGPAHDHLARLLARKRRDDPSARALEPWEHSFFGMGYLDQRIRREEFGVDLKRLRNYLPYGRVRDGLFALCGTLLGIRFRRVAAEAWHPTVEVYDATLRGRPLGRVYLDLVPRDGKFTHAACFTIRTGLEGVQLPHAALICNFVDPSTPAERCRLEYGEVVTFFHEFGHLLHTLLSGHGRWLYNSASNLEWDFIEAPSQLFEEWARDPDTLSRFARNPDTNEVVPTDLLRRLTASASFGRPCFWLRQVALADVALDLYSRDPTGRDLAAAARDTYAHYMGPELRPEYHLEASFGHLTGYSAYYYTYAWSVVIARDLLRPFFDRGSLTDRDIAERYAREILAPGSARPASELVRRYLGREFGFEAFETWVAEPARVPGPSAPAVPARRSLRRTRVSPDRRRRAASRKRSTSPRRRRAAPRATPRRPRGSGRG